GARGAGRPPGGVAAAVPPLRAVAAVAAVAAEALVAEKRAVADREGRAGVADSAPWATTAITTGPARTARTARAAEGSVSEERAVCHGHGRGGVRPNEAVERVLEGAAHANPGVTAVLAGPAVGPVAPARQVAREGAVQHRRLAAACTFDGAGHGVALEEDGTGAETRGC